MGCKALQLNQCFRFISENATPQNDFRFVGDDRAESVYSVRQNKFKFIAEEFIGDDVLSQTLFQNSSTPELKNFLYDGHGSTRLLTSATSAISARFNYDAYGTNLFSANTTSPAQTDMLYSGEQFDPNLQMQYLRARYYDQSNGRFNRLDPFAGNNHDPQSLHKYAYGHCEPVMNVDPSGLMTLVELQANMSTTMTNFIQIVTKVLNVYNKAQTFIEILQTLEQIRSGGLNKLITDEIGKLATNALLGGHGKLLRVRVDTLLEILQNLFTDLTLIVASIVKVHSKRLFTAFASLKLTRSKRDRLVVYGPTLSIGRYYQTHKRLVKIPGLKVGRFKTVMTIGGNGGRLFGIGFSKARQKKEAYQILRVDWHGSSFRHNPAFSGYFKVNGDEFHWQIPENTSEARK